MGKNKTRTVKNKDIFEGERLADLLTAIQREIESSKKSTLHGFPIKFWYKQHFAIGVNEVTRILERMPPVGDANCSSRFPPENAKLQAVLVAGDCNPKWLTKHIDALAMSRRVPLVFVEDNKRGSFRLGELVMIKTAIAVGIKDKGNAINNVVAECLGLTS